MRRETQGANTHKGLIFSMGILCGAAGRLFGLERPVTVDHLCKTSGSMLDGVVDHELASLKAPATMASAPISVTARRERVEKPPADFHRCARRPSRLKAGRGRGFHQ
jgi:triphosphoribosyl-dephospho-CoA synthetase